MDTAILTSPQYTWIHIKFWIHVYWGCQGRSVAPVVLDVFSETLHVKVLRDTAIEQKLIVICHGL